MPLCGLLHLRSLLVAGLVVALGLGAFVGYDGVCAAEQGALHMAAKSLTVYDFTLDDIDGKPVHLTGKEYGILELLALRKGTTLAKETFLNHLYNGMDEPEIKIIDVK